MQIKKIHPGFIMPTKGTEHAAGMDLYMPEAGFVTGVAKKINLGFAASVPEGYVALLMPRSSMGAKHGLELNNTCGIIDSDYRGEWIAYLRTKNGNYFSWVPGDRLLQCIVVPHWSGALELVDELSESERGSGGFGSTGR